ncbi:MBL fold metallo-hydrolase [Winogradskyella sp. MH6]|uniref:MBL fold metallo-hydrolase n=1 Tax=Winogradskyella sp. MH6 TaxID=2929510 RepID=UPI001FB2BC5E|nr:MBL fold metallo-hydrolase [Winogradskyella sp. MH6]
MIYKTKLICVLSLAIFIGKCSEPADNFTVTNVSENVYSIVSPSIGLPTPENKGWNSNVHFIVTGKGVLLFDTGSSELIGNKIKSTIKSITNQPVRWVINSHSHADHWLGNAAFADAEIIASNQAFETMKKYGKDDVAFYAKVTNGTIGSTKLKYPNLLLHEPQKRTFGGLEVEFIFANDGHSEGDVLMWLPEQKIIFGGDVLSSDWMPIITNYSNLSNLINTLQTVAKLNPSVVLTGHGNVTTAASVLRDVQLLSSVCEQVKLDYEKGLTPTETLLKVSANLGPKYEPLYKDFETEIERYINLMYQFNKKIRSEN